MKEIDHPPKGLKIGEDVAAAPTIQTKRYPDSGQPNNITRKNVIQWAKDLVEHLEFGCSDGGCCIRPRGGQHTNGGCICKPKTIADDLEWMAREIRNVKRENWNREGK